MTTENIILKLSSGEEIVCKLTDDIASKTYQIENPLLVSSIPKITRQGIEESVSLRRWVHFSEEEVFQINKSSVILKVSASVGLSKFYEVCVTRMRSESPDDDIWIEPTDQELDEIEMEEQLELFSNVSKTIH
jgi:hypothetical protein|tara:strand:- start:1884 stop:2282 length:399 start_codon:yes stop_codon:yes gene_type:complete